MANATTTTLGDIQLAGDLAGNNNAIAPELTATAVTAGSYIIPHITVDAKGRITAASNGTTAELTSIVPHASDEVYGTVKIGDNIMWDATDGYVVVNYGGSLTGSSQTNLCVIADTISTTITQILNGNTTTRTIKITGADANGTVNDFITAFNAALTAAGLSVVLSLSSGNLVLTITSGAGNTVTISNDNIFANITSYVGVLTNVEGTGDGTIWIPIATDTVAGVVKVGDGLSVDINGVISADVAEIDDATTSTKGLVQIGSGLSVTAGVVSVPTATTSVKGVLQVTEGNGLTLTSGTLALDAYVPPTATTSVKGVLQVTEGNGLTLTSGTLALAAPSYSDATTSTKGVVQIGTNISVSSGTISVPTATTSVKGVVRVGDGLSVTSGLISASNADATGLVKGLLKVTEGNGLTISNGTLSLAAYNAPDATTSTKGVVQIGNGISVASGVISIADATTSTKGVVQVGTNINVTSGTISVPTATTSVKGVLKVTEGNGLALDAGVLSFDTSSLPLATNSTVGVVTVATNQGLDITDGVLSYTFPDATNAQIGVVQIGSGLSVTGGVVSADIPTATTSVKGILQVTEGNGLVINAGVLSVTPYPNATTSTPGIVQIGSGLSVTSGTVSAIEGTTSVKGILQVGSGLSVTAGVVSVPTATTSVKGVLQVTEGNGLTLSAGTLSLAAPSIPDATTSVKGLMQVGTGLSVTSGTVSLGTATSSVIGGIKVGTSMQINAGVLDIAGTTAGFVTLDTVNTFTKAQIVSLSTISSSSTVNVDMNAANVFSNTLTSNATMTLSNEIVGGQYTVILIQDATGSRTMTWPTGFKFRSGQSSVLSTAANATDILVFTCISAGNYLCDLIKGY